VAILIVAFLAVTSGAGVPQWRIVEFPVPAEQCAELHDRLNKTAWVSATCARSDVEGEMSDGSKPVVKLK
jgi:hypothetical protein